MSQHDTLTHQRRRPRETSSPAVALRQRRMTKVTIFFIVAFCILAVRLFDIQIIEHHSYLAASNSQSRRDIPIPALRAGIYDRYGKVLAVSRPTSTVIADDFQITDPVKEAAALSPFLNIPVTQLIPLLSEKNGYVVLSGSVDLAAGHQLSNLNEPGIVVEDSSTRTYPNGTLAQSLLGGTNATGAGSAGLEYEYQKVLGGQTGVMRAFTSLGGINLPQTHTQVITKATPGVGLELTLDTSLQYVTEQALARQLKAVDGITGQAVVMDVKTGQILADASLVNTKTNPGPLGPIPAWGKSVGVDGIEQTINNLPFSSDYEPGSVFKAVTFSAALQAGSISPSSGFTVPGQVVVGNRLFHDAEKHGTIHLTATQILAQSSNIGTYLVGKTVGESGILAQVERLGFGQLTAVNYPGETSGLLVSAANFYPADQVALPIGQVDAVPMIQVLDAYNAIANGGVFVEPTLVRAYVGSDGSLKSAAKSISRPVLSPAVDKEMVSMLEQVVLAGTGTNAIIPGYAVAGKTGTATIPYPGKDKLLTGQYNASFVGFAPANAPVLSMMVVIERPLTTIFGGSAAAPVFQTVMSYALHHYGIPSNGTVEHPLKGAASIASDVT